MAGQAPTPNWLATDRLLGQFGEQRTRARQRYRQFVSEGIKQGDIWSDLRQQVYLGDEKFVERMQAKGEIRGDALSVPRIQRRAPAPSLAEIVERYHERNDAIVATYATGGYSYRQIADYFGLHLAIVGRIVRG